MDATATAEPAVATVTVPAPTVVVRPAPQQVTVVEPTAKTVRTYPPGEHGAVLIEVCDEDSNVIAFDIGDDEDDAILRVADKLRYESE